MNKVTVSIEIDSGLLASYEDSYLATLWHVAQANPAEFGDKQAGELVERIGWEIIRRWLGGVQPSLYNHQPKHHYWDHLRKLGKWVGGEFVPHVPHVPHVPPVPADGDAPEGAATS